MSQHAVLLGGAFNLGADLLRHKRLPRSHRRRERAETRTSKGRGDFKRSRHVRTCFLLLKSCSLRLAAFPICDDTRGPPVPPVRNENGKRAANHVFMVQGHSRGCPHSFGSCLHSQRLYLSPFHFHWIPSASRAGCSGWYLSIARCRTKRSVVRGQMLAGQGIPCAF